MRKKTDSQKYLITCTLEQFRLLQKISECFLRERIGQYWDLAEDLSSEGCGYIYNKEDPDNHAKFLAYIERRNVAEQWFQSAYKTAQTNHLKTTRVLLAEDFYEEIRHAIWKARPEPKPYGINDAYPSLNWGAPEPVPVCHVEGDECTMLVTPAQLRLLQDMCENFMRERMGQFWLIADELAFEHQGDGGKEKLSKEEFQVWLKCRDDAKKFFEKGFAASGADGRKTRKMMIAYDMYSAIRHAIWLESPDPNNHLASTVLHECKEVPLITVEKAE